MGVKAALVAFGDVRAALASGGEPDRDAAEAVVRALHPDCVVEPAEDSTLEEDVYPREGFAYVAVLPEATIVCDQDLVFLGEMPRHVLDFAAGRPMVMFGQHSGSGWLGFAEWDADGTLIRSHDAEEHEYELADSVATEMFGFTAESAPDIVVHGFRVTRPDQVDRDAEMQALVAQMAGQGPTSMRIAPDGSLVPSPD